MEESISSDEFYVPATFQFSRGSGRLERILVGLFDEDGKIEARSVSDDSMPEFYVPAMVPLTKGPGRLERFLQGLRERGMEDEPQEIPEEFRDDFYLPGANPDEYETREE